MPKTFMVAQVNEGKSSSRSITQDMHAFAVNLCRDPAEPRTYHQALDGPESAKWKVAMQEEYDALIKNHT